jgi:hypothetical protein
MDGPRGGEAGPRQHGGRHRSLIPQRFFAPARRCATSEIRPAIPKRNEKAAAGRPAARALLVPVLSRASSSSETLHRFDLSMFGAQTNIPHGEKNHLILDVGCLTVMAR